MAERKGGIRISSPKHSCPLPRLRYHSTMIKTLPSQPRLPAPLSFGRCMLVLASCCALMSIGHAQPSPVARHGQLRVEGNRIVDRNGNPVVLQGMSFFWSQWMGKFYNTNVVRWLRDDWHCTVVRAAMAVEAGGYLANPEREKEKIKTVIQAAIDLGIYVIIDWHDH